MSESVDPSPAPETRSAQDHQAGTGPNLPGWLLKATALGRRVLAVAGLGVVLWIIASELWVVTASIAVAIVVPAMGVVAATWRTVLALIDGDQIVEAGRVPSADASAYVADGPSASVATP